MGTDQKKADHPSLFQLFRFADGVDKWLMFLGTLGCIGDGLIMPVNMSILGGLVDIYGASDSSFNYHVVNKVIGDHNAKLKIAFFD